MEHDFDALDSALLPQYKSSLAFMERFLVAAHAPGSPIERCESKPGLKYVDQAESGADGLEYFIANKDGSIAESVGIERL